MRYRIGLYDLEKNYSESLMKYINSNFYEKLNAISFQDITIMTNYLGENSLDLLLIGDCENTDFFKQYPLIYLVSDKYSVGENRLFKYQNVRMLTTEIIRILDYSYMTKKKKGMFIGVYSPLGRCGKTNFSKALCLANHSSLYVGLEDVSDFFLSDNQTKQELKEIYERFIYFLVTENVMLMDLLFRIQNSRDFQMIKAVGGIGETSQLTFQNIKWFKQLLSKENSYQNVIFDLGNGAVTDVNILKCFDQIYIPVLGDQMSVSKLETFKQRYSKVLEELAGRIDFIFVPQCEYDSEVMRDFVRECLWKS